MWFARESELKSAVCSPSQCILKPPLWGEVIESLKVKTLDWFRLTKTGGVGITYSSVVYYMYEFHATPKTGNLLEIKQIKFHSDIIIRQWIYDE